MKKISLLFTVCAGLLLASCGGGKVENTPEAVAKAFFEKIQKGDFKGAKKYASKSSAEGLDALESMGSLAKGMGGNDEKMKNAKVEVGKATIDGDKASLVLSTDGEKHDVNLVKEDGAWKVEFKKSDMNKGTDSNKKEEPVMDGTTSTPDSLGNAIKEGLDKLNDPKVKEMMDKVTDKDAMEKLQKELDEAMKKNEN